MSKEVKRYDPLAGLARNAKLRRMEMQCDPQWVLDLLAERDALKKDAERYRWLRNSERMIGEYADDHEHNICVSSADGEDVLWFDQLDTAIDAALQGEQP